MSNLEAMAVSADAVPAAEPCLEASGIGTTAGPTDAGKALYEERLKALHGLWMPAAPVWEDLPAEVKERWRSYADVEQQNRPRYQ